MGLKKCYLTKTANGMIHSKSGWFWMYWGLGPSSTQRSGMGAHGLGYPLSRREDDGFQHPAEKKRSGETAVPKGNGHTIRTHRVPRPRRGPQRSGPRPDRRRTARRCPGDGEGRTRACRERSVKREGEPSKPVMGTRPVNTSSHTVAGVTAMVIFTRWAKHSWCRSARRLHTSQVPSFFRSRSRQVPQNP